MPQHKTTFTRQLIRALVGLTLLLGVFAFPMEKAEAACTIYRSSTYTNYRPYSWSWRGAYSTRYIPISRYLPGGTRIRAKISIYGDFNASSEYLVVWAYNRYRGWVYLGTLNPYHRYSNCRSMTRIFTLDSSFARAGYVYFKFYFSRAVSYYLCGRARVYSQVYYERPYCGTTSCVRSRYSKTIYYSRRQGRIYNHMFYSLRSPRSDEEVILKVKAFGNFDSSSEYLYLYLNKEFSGYMNPRYYRCLTSLPAYEYYYYSHVRDFKVPPDIFRGGNLLVTLLLSPNVLYSSCSRQRIEISVNYVRKNCNAYCYAVYNYYYKNPQCSVAKPGSPYCRYGRCVECSSSSSHNHSQCYYTSPNTPHCYRYKCVQCRYNSDCPSGYRCNSKHECYRTSSRSLKLCYRFRSSPFYYYYNDPLCIKQTGGQEPNCYRGLCRECFSYRRYYDYVCRRKYGSSRPHCSNYRCVQCPYRSYRTGYCPANKRACTYLSSGKYACVECDHTYSYYNRSYGNLTCYYAYGSSNRKSKPYCYNYKCVACLKNSHCRRFGSNYECVNHQCVIRQRCDRCVSDAWCASNATSGAKCGANKRHCRKTDGYCVECTKDSHCPPGKKCSSTNHCVSGTCPSTCNSDADCLRGDCGTRTKCLNNPNGSGKICTDVSGAAQCQPPNLLVILDRSCSMYSSVDSKNPCRSTSDCKMPHKNRVYCSRNSSLGFKTCRYSRWDTAVYALNKVFTDYGGTPQLNYQDRKVRFGIILFSSSASVVAPIFKEAPELKRILARYNAGGGTRYDRAFTLAKSHIIATRRSDPVKRRKTAILFLTDGAPNEGCSISPRIVDQIYNMKDSTGRALKIKTYVVGFGNGLYSGAIRCLATLAKAGRTERRSKNCQSGSCLYYAADNAAGLSEAFVDIVNNATVEECDGLDNDCNGLIDEGNPGGSCHCVKSYSKPTHTTALSRSNPDYKKGIRLYTFLTSFSNQGTCPVNKDPTRPSLAQVYRNVCRNSPTKAIQCRGNLTTPPDNAYDIYCMRCCNKSQCSWPSSHQCRDYPWTQSYDAPLSVCLNNCKKWCESNRVKAQKCMMPHGYLVRVGTGYNSSGKLAFQSKKDTIVSGKDVEYGDLLKRQRRRYIFVHTGGDVRTLAPHNRPLVASLNKSSGTWDMPTAVTGTIDSRYNFTWGNSFLSPLKMGIGNCRSSQCSTEKNNTISMILGYDSSGHSLRDHRLGAIYNSSPIVMPAPKPNLNDFSYIKWLNTPLSNGMRVTQRPAIVYVGSNDGIMHAFLANLANNPQLIELWGYIPKTVVGKLRAVINGQMPKGGYVYTVDGVPVVKNMQMYRYSDPTTGKVVSKWRTVLVFGLGAGGRGYVAIDVTNPYRPRLLWEINHQSSFTPAGASGPRGTFKRLGYTLGKPFLANILVKWEVNGNTVIQERAVAILPGGVDLNPPPFYGLKSGSTLGGVVYIVDLETGKLIRELIPMNHVAHSRGISGTPVGYGVPPAITSRVFVGDVLSRIFRIDLQSPNPAEWKIELFYDIYKASRKSPNPIMVKPALALNARGELVLFGGTGDLFKLDSIPASFNYIFSIREKIPASAINASDGSIDPSKVQAIHNFIAKLNRINNYNKDDVLLSRTISSSPTGEKLTGPPSIYNNTAYFTTYRPTTDRPICGVSGESIIYAIGFNNTCKTGTCAALDKQGMIDKNITTYKCCQGNGRGVCDSNQTPVPDSRLLSNPYICSDLSYTEPRYLDSTTSPPSYRRFISLGRNTLSMGVNFTYQPGETYLKSVQTPSGRTTHQVGVKRKGRSMIVAWPAGRNRASDTKFMLNARAILPDGNTSTNFFAFKAAKQARIVIVGGWASVFDDY